MHFSLKRAVGVMAVPLLGSALAVGAAALPANAATWQDTSLSASAVTASTFGGAGLGVANGTKVITLVGTGVTWSLHGTVPAGVTLSGGTISYSGTAASTATITVDATDAAGNVEALAIPVPLTSGHRQRHCHPRGQVVGPGRYERLGHREVHRNELGEQRHQLHGVEPAGRPDLRKPRADLRRGHRGPGHVQQGGGDRDRR